MLTNADLADLANAITNNSEVKNSHEEEDSEVFWEQSGDEYFD